MNFPKFVNLGDLPLNPSLATSQSVDHSAYLNFATQIELNSC